MNQEFLSDEEVVRITPAALYFRLAFGTGMRTGELLALTWENYNGASLYVDQSRVRRELKQSTKTDVDRRVLIDVGLQDYLEFCRKDRGVIVTNQYGRPYQSGYHLNRWLTKGCKQLKIRSRQSRHQPYPWRHTYASVGLTRGVPSSFLAAQLGHSLSVFEKTYAKWMPSNDDQALVDKLAQGWRTGNVVSIKSDT